MNRTELIDFVRARGLGVIASRGSDGAPQAALVGIAATDHGELVFDCSRDSRKYANITRDPAVAVVVGWDDEVTVQIERRGDVLSGVDLERMQGGVLRAVSGWAGPGRLTRDRPHPRCTAMAALLGLPLGGLA